MNNLTIKTEQIKIIHSKKEETALEIYLATADFSKEKKFGKLFGILFIESGQKILKDLINIIIEDLENNFYQKQNTSEIGINYNLEENFEKTIQKVNLGIINFIKSRQINVNLEKINILLGVWHQNYLILAPAGKLAAILFHYRDKFNYQIINIIDSAEYVVKNPLKFFSQTIAGKINPQDLIFLCTPTILDYFSLEKIKNIISQNSFRDIGINFKKLLEEIDTKDNFGGLLIKSEKSAPIFQPLIEEEKEEKIDIGYEKLVSTNSMKELIKTEKQTEKLLTPSLIPEIKKYAQSFKEAFKNYLDKIKETSFYKEKKTSPRTVNRMIDETKKIIEPLNKKRLNFFEKLKLPLIIKKIFNYFYQIIIYLNRKINQLPRRRRALLLISLILILLFSLSTIYLGIKQYLEKKSKFYNDTIAAVEQIKNESEASLIYRDENKARELLIKSQELLKQLKVSAAEKRQKITQLNQEIENQLEKLKHAVNISEPVMITNFRNLDAGAEIAGLILNLDNGLYTQNYRNLSIYKVNAETRIISAVNPGSFNIGKVYLEVAIPSKSFLLYNNNKKLIEFSFTEGIFKPINIDFPDNSDFKDMAIYENYLYFLDPKNNQIYRYSKIIDGFGPKISWVNDSTVNLSQSISMAIDGDIYVINSNGEILKLTQGKKQSFEASIYPALKQPTKIKTKIESKYLYILDPPNRRLVVIDKTGRLINQYYSEIFDNLKDFAVIEKEEKIYLLNGEKIFGIPAKHL